MFPHGVDYFGRDLDLWISCDGLSLRIITTRLRYVTQINRKIILDIVTVLL